LYQAKVMGRHLTWVSERSFTGWICSECKWNYPTPELLTDPEAKAAYDRLASAKFQSHDCAENGPREMHTYEDSFTERARKLIARGLKPKDATDIVMQEMMLESRNDPKVLEQLRTQAHDFMRRVREGLL
jgi:hypothetical protein